MSSSLSSGLSSSLPSGPPSGPSSGCNRKLCFGLRSTSPLDWNMFHPKQWQIFAKQKPTKSQTWKQKTKNENLQILILQMEQIDSSDTRYTKRVNWVALLVNRLKWRFHKWNLLNARKNVASLVHFKDLRYLTDLSIKVYLFKQIITKIYPNISIVVVEKPSSTEVSVDVCHSFPKLLFFLKTLLNKSKIFEIFLF